MLMKSKAISYITSMLIVFMIISYAAGIRPFIVMSGSMEPEISTGSICFVNSRTHIEDVKEDDIVTYSLLDSYITHRAVSVSEEGIITKGDANSTDDIGIVNRENYYGKVMFSIPVIGYAFFFIKKEIIPVSVSLIILAAALEIMKRRKLRRKE